MSVSVLHDEVVLLDDLARPSGTALRATVHDRETPLHLAFSCHVVRPDGQVLLTRRALTKASWPGVWTNSFCGHPRPGEDMADAVRRRGRDELGIEVEDLTLMLPDFRYRAVDAHGIVENEVCPVWFATTTSTPVPAPDEVMDVQWASTQDVGRAVRAAPWAFSPWLVAQVDALAELDELDGVDEPPSGTRA